MVWQLFFSIYLLKLKCKDIVLCIVVFYSLFPVYSSFIHKILGCRNAESRRLAQADRLTGGAKPGQLRGRVTGVRGLAFAAFTLNTHRFLSAVLCCDSVLLIYLYKQKDWVLKGKVRSKKIKHIFVNNIYFVQFFLVIWFVNYFFINFN